MQMTMRTSDGAILSFEDEGSGPPLILLHGLTGTGKDWSHAFDLARLRSTYRIIVPDARGHGRSTNPYGAFSFRRCALDVIELMDHLRVPRVRAVGMSLGAKTLLHVATEAPDRIERMILVSGTRRFPETTRALFRAFAATPHSSEEWTAMRAQHVHGDDQIAALWALPARFADDPEDMNFTHDRLAVVTTPTLVVAGDRDPLYPVELAVELYRALPHASLCVVPGGAHGPIFGDEQPRFEAAALGFLSQGS